MQAQQQQQSTPAPSNTQSKSDSGGSQTKKAVQGAEGYDAQAALLAPPQDGGAKSAGPLGNGPELKAVQTRLNDLSFDCGKADGLMGPRTRAALTAFQNKRGLSPTGNADSTTVEALNNSSAQTSLTAGAAGAAGAQAKPPEKASGEQGTKAPAPTIGNGPELKGAQERLNKLKFPAGTPDGVMGPKTKGAIQAFQNTKGLSATGNLDLTTNDQIKDAASKVPDPAPTNAGPANAPSGGMLGAKPPGKDAPEGKDDKKDGPPAPGAPVSGTRLAAASAAFAEVGKVKAKETTGKDEEGKPARVGWDRLAEYFAVSLGGGWKDHELIKRPRKGTKLKHGTTTGETVETSDTLPSWCGIFAIWAVKSAGFSVGTWGIGKSAPNIMKGRSKVPQVGDVVVMSNNNHHALVVWVAPDAAEKQAAGKGNSIEIKTVDGNAGSNPVSGGEVVDKGSSTMAKWDYGAWSPE